MTKMKKNGNWWSKKKLNKETRKKKVKEKTRKPRNPDFLSYLDTNTHQELCCQGNML